MDVFLIKAATDLFWYLAVAAPALFAAKGMARAILILIPAAWLLWLALHWKKRRLADSAPDVFSMQLKLFFAAACLELLFLGPEGWGRQCAPFAALFFAAGILLLRSVRLADSGQKRGSFWRGNGIQLAAAAGLAAVLASGTARRAAWMLLANVYQKLVLPVLLLILNLFVGFLGWLWPYISALFSGLSAGDQEREAVEINTAPLDLGEFGAREAPAYLKALGALLALLAAALFVYWLYRKFSVSGYGREGGNAGEAVRSAFTAPGRKEKKSRLFGGEKNVRYYYRRFLKLCRDKGMELGPGDTTEDIQRRASLWWKEEALSELRTLYLEARYGGQEEEQGRKRAKELYRKMKGDQHDIS